MSNKTSNTAVPTKSTNAVDVCVAAVRKAIAPAISAQKKLDGCNATLAETFDTLALTLLPIAPNPDAVCWVNLSTDDRVTHNKALEVPESKVLINLAQEAIQRHVKYQLGKKTVKAEIIAAANDSAKLKSISNKLKKNANKWWLTIRGVSNEFLVEAQNDGNTTPRKSTDDKRKVVAKTAQALKVAIEDITSSLRNKDEKAMLKTLAKFPIVQ
jgi:leucyl-tRNA synthetase